MTVKQAVALGVRLFSIWLFVFLVQTAPAWWLITANDVPRPAGAIATVIAVTCLIALVALLLWLFPLTVARKLLPRSALDQTIALPPAEQIERAGFCLLGLWVLAQALPGLIREIFVFCIYTRAGSTFEWSAQDYASLAEVLVRSGIAIWLLFGAKGLQGFVGWARSVGTRSAADEPPQAS
jgi:hypothetical protein